MFRNGRMNRMSDNRALYLECAAGISGDMLVAALLDLGADKEKLIRVLHTIPAGGFEVKISRVKKAGLDCCDFDVVLDEEHENHDHDMAYLHGEGHEHGHGADEAAGHAGHEHHHAHMHRGLQEITEILGKTQMSTPAREIAGRIFDILAEAEAKAHGVPKEEVHFHEVGAIDSIVDIVAIAVCTDDLGIEQIIVPHLNEGSGTIRCQHGILPVPVPAVTGIVSAYGICMKIMDVQGEFVTPTGAAAVAALRTSDRLPEQFRIMKTGLGAGKREYEVAGILRAMVITAGEQENRICKLESNIDDCSGEALGHVMNLLLEAGARDVHYIPVYMKKNRPGWQLNVICMPEDIQRLEKIIFMQTTTIGIRRVMMERTALERTVQTVHTAFGDAEVKVCEYEGIKRFYPEYESVIQLCSRSGMGYPEMYAQVQQLAAGEKQ